MKNEKAKAWQSINELERHALGFTNYQDYKNFIKNYIKPIKEYLMKIEDEKEKNDIKLKGYTENDMGL